MLRRGIGIYLWRGRIVIPTARLLRRRGSLRWIRIGSNWRISRRVSRLPGLSLVRVGHRTSLRQESLVQLRITLQDLYTRANNNG